VRDMGLKFYLRPKSRIFCWRFEDCDKTTRDGIPWAADAVESRSHFLMTMTVERSI
jgi:hypothetical protein